jgi:Lysozyme like domain
VTQATAAAKSGHATENGREASEARVAQTLGSRLVRKLDAADRYRSTIRFFSNHRSLLSSTQHQASARTALQRAQRRLADARKTINAIQRLIRKREAAQTAASSPRGAICRVFGEHCEEAVAVAWCESRLEPDAQNGQYLGLFQMGSQERRLFGHGKTARKQAVAAHTYFVHSGRDWSPWSCKPWYRT